MSSLNLEFVRSPEDEFKSKLTPGDWQVLFKEAEKSSDSPYLIRIAQGGQLLKGPDYVEAWPISKADMAVLANAKELFNTVLNLKAIIENSDVSTGVCMCGEGVSGHADPFDCGHSAVDSGAYYAVSALKAANKLVSDILKD